MIIKYVNLMVNLNAVALIEEDSIEKTIRFYGQPILTARGEEYAPTITLWGFDTKEEYQEALNVLYNAASPIDLQEEMTGVLVEA